MRTNGPLQLYPLLRIAVSMAVGVAVGYWARIIVGETVWLSAFLVAVVMAVAVRRHEMLQGLLLCVAALLLGATLTSRRCRVLFAPLPAGEVSYEAVVASQPEERGRVVRMDLWLVGGPLSGRRVKASVLRDTVERRYERLAVGDGLVATSVLQAPSQFYPSRFDYPLYLRCHGFTATTLILPGEWRKVAVDLTPLSHLERTVLAAKKFRQATLRHYLSLGLDDDEMAVAVAMALGDRSRITNDLRDIYSISGASHVLALSGLHLGIIYALLSFLLRVGRQQWLREMFIILGIWSYAVFTGLSPSVVRASAMITVFSLASLLHRRRMSLNALSLTVIVMLMVQPMNLMDVGFQMSVMAVLAILVCYRPVYRLIPAEFLQSHAVVKWLWAMAVVSCCAQLGVAPLTAYYFGRFSVYFLLTNYIVIPLAILLLYLTAALFVSALCPPVAPFVAKALACVVSCQTQAARWVASLPGASIEGITLSPLQLAMVYVLIGALCVVAYEVMKMKNLLR